MLRNPLLSNATKSSLDNEFKNSFPIPIIILVYGIELTNIASFQCIIHVNFMVGSQLTGNRHKKGLDQMNQLILD